MAVLSTGQIMEIFDGEKNIHPFFEKRTKTCDDRPGAAPIPLNTTIASKYSVAAFSEGDGGTRDERSALRNPLPVQPAQRSNSRIIGGSKVFKEQSAELLDVDPNLGRRKRQKSVSPDAENHRHKDLDTSTSNVHIQGDGKNWQTEAISSSEENDSICGTGLAEVPRGTDFFASPSTILTSGSEGPIQQDRINISSEPVERLQFNEQPPLRDAIQTPNEERVTIDPTSINTPKPILTKPKKQLRLNLKTGTIGSPPAKKPSIVSKIAIAKKSEKAQSKAKSTLVIIIKYGHDRETRPILGRRIDEIFCGSKNISQENSPVKPLSALPPVQIPKSTHPFFVGKAAPVIISPHNIPAVPTTENKLGVGKRSKSSMTLGEAKSHSPSRKVVPANNLSGFQCFGNKTKILKFPGAVEACWPPKGMVHIKFSEDIGSISNRPSHVSNISELKKSKYTATETLAKENILTLVTAELDIENTQRSLKTTNADDFTKPQKALRLPIKHFENGYQLQRRVQRELSVKIFSITTSGTPSDSEDELHGDGIERSVVHPAPLKVFNSLPHSLTAFDRSQYETQSWIHKYAPRTAAEVLQSGKEPFILKEWLQSLTITVVDSVITDATSSRAGSVASRQSGKTNPEKSGKKKRKSNKLEGFVVSSDDETNEMDEITDPEEHSEGCRPGKRTVVRSGQSSTNGAKDSKKLKNATVISGPSGCGKTAMVYAVAKELGFEVFEINSSSRRSGKEILEKVGDMTRNHLVHLADHPGSSDPQNEDIQRISDAFSADLKSGRQGTMNSFFKPKKSGTPTLKATGPKKVKKMVNNEEALKPSKPPPKQQTQSLILLEEVDILFEEDKQFWATVMSLISQSKRPIIMTCNDETLLPLQALELHAIIRLSPSPPEIAIDYMLLVAASEGHLVKRKAIETLYKARENDLRASLTELDYWCQLGIGDRKGGLDWYYPRWPPGCDVDESGHTIRVVSEGTYKSGIGWLGRDAIFEHPEQPSVKEEILREAWDWWNIDIGDWHDSFQLTSWQESVREPHASALLSYEAFAQSMSNADICGCGSFARGNQVALNTDFAMLTERAREDFTIGNELLHVDATTSYNMLGKDIAIWMKRQAQELSQPAGNLSLDWLSESKVFSKITENRRRTETLISRRDFSIAFDPIAEPEKSTLPSSSSLEPSVFDRTTTTIALDVAPYVRSIVAYDGKLQQERARLSNLLSEGGRKGKRLRTTRSALSALEGGPRKSTRPEKYFRAALNPHLVNRTGVPSWQEAISMETSETEIRLTPPTVGFYESGSPGMTDSS